MTFVRTRVALLTGAALAALGASPAFADSGTAANTQIDNQASVSYNIGGNPATAVLSNTVSFKVDKKVDLTVTSLGITYVSVGTTDQISTFTVTNNTNAPTDFLLGATNTPLPLGILGLGDFQPGNVRVYADTDGNGVYTPGTDKPFIYQLGADLTMKVFVVSDIPTGTIHTGNVQLTVTAATGATTTTAGTPMAATGLLVADTPGAVDVVFADSASTDAPLLDGARDGKKIAFGQYQIESATITAVKSSTVISDPINGIAFPKAIPGAIVKYCITVSNAGTGNATAVVVNDSIPTATTYVPSTVFYGPTACATSIGATAGTFDGSAVHATIGTLTTLVPITVSFQVKIN